MESKTASASLGLFVRSLVVLALSLLSSIPEVTASEAKTAKTTIKDGAVFPEPFSRALSYVAGQSWQLNGSDVVIAQHLLKRSPFAKPTTQCCSGIFDKDTAEVVKSVQVGAGLQVESPGTLDVATATYVLKQYSFDGYFDNGRSAREQGYSFKIMVPVHSNRSVETNGTLLDADGNVVFTFPARAHGHDVLPNGQPDDRPWPDYDNDNGGLNQFSSSGATPTGLSQCDLNSPEDDPKLYGPYPIVRVVQGIQGNAGFLLPFVRNGILLHTGEWPSLSPTMPNSAGCIHTHPDALKSIGELLQAKCNVVVNNNTNGELPYPYQPQGLISVYQID